MIDLIEYFDKEQILGYYETNIEYATQKGFLRNVTDTAWVNGEDSTFFMGQYYTAINLLRAMGETDVDSLPYSSMQEQNRLMQKLYWGYGIYRRTPNPASFMSDPFRVGRDQQKSVISAESFQPGSWRRVVPFILNHLFTRGLLFDAKLKKNGTQEWKFPTFTGPTIWASYIRYGISKSKLFYALYPMLLIFDLEILVNTYVKQNSQLLDDDVNNHIVLSIWHHHVAPTPLSYLNLKMMRKGGFKARLKQYYSKYGRPPVLYALWSRIMDKYIGEETL